MVVRKIAMRGGGVAKKPALMPDGNRVIAREGEPYPEAARLPIVEQYPNPDATVRLAIRGRVLSAQVVKEP